jgi:predicted acylesterase/phospholipase RssA
VITAAPSSPRSLVLCGGGITGAMYEFGALHALDHACGGQLLSTGFDIYVGTSGGAVVAALMANGVTPAEVGRAILGNRPEPLNFRQDDIVQIDWKEIRQSLGRALRMVPAVWRQRKRNPGSFSIARLIYVFEENLPSGIYSLDRYRAYLKKLLSDQGRCDSFAALPHELYIPAVHLDTGDRVLFGAPEWRDVPISDAIAASSALPLYFRPVTLKGMDFVDGGVGQVVHLDKPLERGSRFIVLINPVLPIRNEEGVVCIPTFTGLCARLREKGVTFVVDQAQRIGARERFRLGLEHVRARAPEAVVTVIEPDPRDSVLFMENILNYGSRVAMLHYGYRSTAAQIRSRHSELSAAFASAGLTLSVDGLREEDPWDVAGEAARAASGPASAPLAAAALATVATAAAAAASATPVSVAEAGASPTVDSPADDEPAAAAPGVAAGSAKT